MAMPVIAAPESRSPLTSPRSSTSSSSPSAPPLTPMFDLTSTVGQMSVAETSSSETETDEGDDTTPPKPTSSQLSPGADFANFAFSNKSNRPPSAIPSTEPALVSPSELPKAGFSFGTCPSTPFVGTPTAEKGQFEYPNNVDLNEEHDPSFQNTPSNSHPFALGQTHRRSSIVPRRSSADRRPSIEIDRRPSHPSLHSPPYTRRSSTSSSIATLPLSGRRPSILHSATHPTLQPISSSPSQTRRPSLMFPPKALPIAIPPSLLARRESLPAALLFGLPTSDLPRHPARASFAAPASAGYTTTTPALYHRRDSLLSESGESSLSTSTSTQTNTTRRGSLRPEMSSPAFPPAGGSRRSSLPFLSDLPPHQSPMSSRRSQPHVQSPISRLSTSSHTASPRRRQASNTTRSSSKPSLSSSEESNDEDADSLDPLPTPSSLRTGSIGEGPSFTDPWADMRKGEVGKHMMGVEGLDDGEVVRRSSTSGRGGRPPLETIASDDTERGG